VDTIQEKKKLKIHSKQALSNEKWDELGLDKFSLFHKLKQKAVGLVEKDQNHDWDLTVFLDEMQETLIQKEINKKKHEEKERERFSLLEEKKRRREEHERQVKEAQERKRKRREEHERQVIEAKKRKAEQDKKEQEEQKTSENLDNTSHPSDNISTDHIE